MTFFNPLMNSLTKLAVIFGLITLLFIPLTGNAQAKKTDGAGGAGIGALNILQIDCLFPGAPSINGGSCSGKNLAGEVTGFLRGAAFPLAVLVIIWGGYQYFVGGIDGKGNGMKAIQAAVIGLLVIVSADFIVKAIFPSGNSGGASIIQADGTLNAAGVIGLATLIKNFLVGISGAVAVVVMMWGGYKYFFTGLDFEKEGGLKAIKNSVIGLVVILVANGLFDFVQGFVTAASKPGATAQSIFDLIQKNLVIPFLGSITGVLIGLAAAVAVLTIIWGGYKYFFAGLQAAKEDGLKNIRNGVIGLGAVILSQTMVTLIQAILPGTKSGPGTTPEILNIQKDPILNVLKVLISDIIIPTSAGVAVFFAVLASYNWITSGGDQKKIENAQKGVKNAVIGLIVMLVAATAIQLLVFIYSSTANSLT